jgi:hypothetical protein
MIFCKFLPHKGSFCWNVPSKVIYAFYLKLKKYPFCAPTPLSETESDANRSVDKKNPFLIAVTVIFHYLCQGSAEEVLWTCLGGGKEVERKWQGSGKEVARMWRGSGKEVARKYLGSAKEVPRKCQGSANEGTKKY